MHAKNFMSFFLKQLNKNEYNTFIQIKKREIEDFDTLNVGVSGYSIIIFNFIFGILHQDKRFYLG